MSRDLLGLATRIFSNITIEIFDGLYHNTDYFSGYINKMSLLYNLGTWRLNRLSRINRLHNPESIKSTSKGAKNTTRMGGVIKDFSEASALPM